VTPRAPAAPDPSPAAGGRPPVVTPQCVNPLAPANRAPLADRCETTGTEPASVTAACVTADRPSARAVGVPTPSSGSDRHESQPPSPFSLRKVVLARPPADPLASEDDVAARQSTSSEARTAPRPSSTRAQVDTASQSSDTNASADEPRAAAVSSGLRWTMIRTAVVEGLNLLGVVVLARLVGPAEFGRYAIALIVLLLATVPTWAV
jgi:hypothetical protein